MSEMVGLAADQQHFQHRQVIYHDYVVKTIIKSDKQYTMASKYKMFLNLELVEIICSTHDNLLTHDRSLLLGGVFLANHLAIVLTNKTYNKQLKLTKLK